MASGSQTSALRNLQVIRDIATACIEDTDANSASHVDQEVLEELPALIASFSTSVPDPSLDTEYTAALDRFSHAYNPVPEQGLPSMQAGSTSSSAWKPEVGPSTTVLLLRKLWFNHIARPPVTTLVLRFPRAVDADSCCPAPQALRTFLHNGSEQATALLSFLFSWLMYAIMLPKAMSCLALWFSARAAAVSKIKKTEKARAEGAALGFPLQLASSHRAVIYEFLYRGPGKGPLTKTILTNYLAELDGVLQSPPTSSEAAKALAIRQQMVFEELYDADGPDGLALRVFENFMINKGGTLLRTGFNGCVPAAARNDPIVNVWAYVDHVWEPLVRWTATVADVQMYRTSGKSLKAFASKAQPRSSSLHNGESTLTQLVQEYMDHGVPLTKEGSSELSVTDALEMLPVMDELRSEVQVLQQQTTVTHQQQDALRALLVQLIATLGTGKKAG